MPEIVVGVSLEKMIFFSAWIYVFLIGFLGQKQSCNTDLGIKFALIC